jgi:hypothetical protein
MRRGITKFMQAKSSEEWDNAVKEIDDPYDMLAILKYFNDSCGLGDRYYRDMENLLWKQVDKIMGD